MKLHAVDSRLSASFWRIWSSAAAAALSDGMVRVTLPLIAVSFTTSPSQLALIVVAGQAPLVLFGLLAGTLADRMDRRKTMLFVHVTRAIVLALVVLLALAGGLSIAVLGAAAFLIGTGETFFESNAQTILPMAVVPEDLGRANTRLFAVETLMSMFVGPPLGGLLVAASIALALAGASIGYAIAAVALVALRGSYRASSGRVTGGVVGSLRIGLGYLASSQSLVALAVMSTMGRFGGAVAFALLPLFVVSTEGLASDSGTFAGLLVAQGVGSLVGSGLVDRLVRRIGDVRSMGIATMTFGFSLVLPGLFPVWIAAVTGMFASGFASMIWNVTNLTYRQSKVPIEYLGRLQATHRFVSNVGAIAGGIVSGVVGEALGVRAAFIVGGAVVVLAAISIRFVGPSLIPNQKAASGDR